MSRTRGGRGPPPGFPEPTLLGLPPANKQGQKRQKLSHWGALQKYEAHILATEGCLKGLNLFL